MRALLRQVLAQPRPLPQLDDLRVGRLQPPETVRVGPQRRGQHPRVPTVVLRARRRDTVPGLIEWTTKPRSIRVYGYAGIIRAPPAFLQRHIYVALDNNQSVVSARYERLRSSCRVGVASALAQLEKVVDGLRPRFAQAAALLRLVGAILMEQDDEWAVADRRYFSAESMRQLTQPLPTTTAQELLTAIA